MWSTLTNLLRTPQSYFVSYNDKRKPFSNFLDAAVYAENLENKDLVEVYYGTTKLAWKLPKRMGTWQETKKKRFPLGYSK